MAKKIQEAYEIVMNIFDDQPMEGKDLLKKVHDLLVEGFNSAPEEKKEFIKTALKNCDEFARIYDHLWDKGWDAVIRECARGLIGDIERILGLIPPQDRISPHDLF